MPPLVSNVRCFSGFVSNEVSISLLIRHGYASVPQGDVSSEAKGAGKARSSKGQSVATREQAPWVPDPNTGYYRPDHSSKDVDAAEQRAAVPKNSQ